MGGVGHLAMTLSASLRFNSEMFDYTSELPEDYNAGNRFYGKDLAEYLKAGLADQGLKTDLLDEDWGWLVFSTNGGKPEMEIAVYNLAEHGEGGRPGIAEWGLWIRTYEKQRLLGFLPVRREVQVPERLLNAIRAVVARCGAQAEPWNDGPGNA